MSGIPYADILKDWYKEDLEAEKKEAQKFISDCENEVKTASKCSECSVDFIGNGFDLLGYLSSGKAFCASCKEKYESKAIKVIRED